MLAVFCKKAIIISIPINCISLFIITKSVNMMDENEIVNGKKFQVRNEELMFIGSSKVIRFDFLSIESDFERIRERIRRTSQLSNFFPVQTHTPGHILVSSYTYWISCTNCTIALTSDICSTYVLYLKHFWLDIKKLMGNWNMIEVSLLGFCIRSQYILLTRIVNDFSRIKID